MISFTPNRSEVELLIRLCCKPDVGSKSRWARVDFPVEVAIRQCGAESSFRHGDPETGDLNRSACGAIGLFQLMPATAKELRVNPEDWRANVHGGVKYDKILYVRYSGDLGKVLAAYNWGMGKVDEAIRQLGESGWKKALPKETIQYVRKVLDLPSIGGGEKKTTT